MLRSRLPLAHLRLVSSITMQVGHLSDREMFTIAKFKLGMSYDNNVLKGAHTDHPYLLRQQQHKEKHYLFNYLTH